jgi:hypothetical protein
MIYTIRTTPIYSGVKPVRDPAYLRYLRQFPCAGCATTRQSRDAAHQGAHGLGQKASDLDAVPLCRECHKRLHKIGPVEFWSANSRDPGALQRMFRRFYRLKHGTPSWWPSMPSLTLETCVQCGTESFTEELEIAGKCECGREYERQEAA